MLVSLRDKTTRSFGYAQMAKLLNTRPTIFLKVHILATIPLQIMKYSADKKDQYIVFRLLEPKLDTLVAPEMKAEMAVLGNEGHKNMVLNLEAVTFVDSSGLSAILLANRQCKDSGGKLVVCNARPAVMKLIQISQLDQILHLADSEVDAISSLS
jgi:anti-sigma B factor antagonist